MSKADLLGLLAALARARKTLEDTDVELDAVEQCLQEAIAQLKTKRGAKR